MTASLFCTRCKAYIPPVFEGTDQGDNALIIYLDGGYSQFIDAEADTKERFVLCHKCGHEYMTDFMNIPAKDYKGWHPKTDDPFCEGWTI